MNENSTTDPSTQGPRATRATLSVKNFERFQHYKKRRPPWIKLYAAMWDDPEFVDLPELTRLHLINLWVLASLYDNAIPYAIDLLAPRMRVASTALAASVELLINRGFIRASGSASTMLAPCLHDASIGGGTETEAEADRRTSQGSEVSPARTHTPPPAPARTREADPDPPPEEDTRSPIEKFPQLADPVFLGLADEEVEL